VKAVIPVLAALLAAGPAVAELPQKGEVTIAPLVGTQWFDEKLDLQSEVALGLRIGMSLDRRFNLLMEYLQSDPARGTTGDPARVSSLRALAQCLPVAYVIQPYLLGGFGGVLFNFEDTNDTAGGSASVGGGLEFQPSRRARIFAEYTAEFYRMRNITYSSTGSVVSTSERTTDMIQTISVGVGVGF
jgi:hypothetical protein